MVIVGVNESEFSKVISPVLGHPTISVFKPDATKVLLP